MIKLFHDTTKNLLLGILLSLYGITFISCSSGGRTGWMEGTWEIPIGVESWRLLIHDGQYKLDWPEDEYSLIVFEDVPGDDNVKSFGNGMFHVDLEKHAIIYSDGIEAEKVSNKVISAYGVPEKTQQKSVSAPYYVQNKKDKIEKAFVNAFNDSPKHSLTFHTGLQTRLFDNAEIMFSITPQDEEGSVTDGYIMFWYENKNTSHIIRECYGNYELIGDCLRVYNVYDYDRKRLYDRKYTIAIGGKDITLSGKAVNYQGLDMVMVLDNNARQLSHSYIAK